MSFVRPVKRVVQEGHLILYRDDMQLIPYIEGRNLAKLWYSALDFSNEFENKYEFGKVRITIEVLDEV